MAKTLRVHPYERSPHSGAGNCWCGWSRDSIMHPHEPVGSLVSDGMKCVCGKSVEQRDPRRGGGRWLETS